MSIKVFRSDNVESSTILTCCDMLPRKRHNTFTLDDDVKERLIDYWIKESPIKIFNYIKDDDSIEQGDLSRAMIRTALDMSCEHLSNSLYLWIQRPLSFGYYVASWIQVALDCEVVLEGSSYVTKFSPDYIPDLYRTVNHKALGDVQVGFESERLSMHLSGVQAQIFSTNSYGTVALSAYEEIENQKYLDELDPEFNIHGI